MRKRIRLDGWNSGEGDMGMDQKVAGPEKIDAPNKSKSRGTKRRGR
jgi:hypothetical protein